ncbi:MAG: CbiX/SirB N-terminal domain-containing protein, partial [Betaproteobacteria bacterium]
VAILLFLKSLSGKTPAGRGYNCGMPDQGMILFAHGARDTRWAEPFERLKTRVEARRPDLAVALAYLEHLPPDLAAAAVALAARGALRVRIVPLFFGRGGHLRDDFPQHVARAQAAAPAVEIEITAAAGEDAAVVEALADFALANLD